MAQTKAARRARPATGVTDPTEQRKLFADAHNSYFEARRTAEADAQRPFIEAYEEYCKTLADPSSSEDPIKPVEAYRRYLERAREAESSSKGAERAVEAYRQYVAAMRDAWAAVDPGAVDPSLVAEVGQSLTTVSLFAVST